MYSVNPDDEKNKKKKSDGLNSSFINKIPDFLFKKSDSLQETAAKDSIPAPQQPYVESYGKNAFFDKPFFKEMAQDTPTPFPVVPEKEQQTLSAGDSLKKTLDAMPDSVRYSPFRYYDRTDPWEKHMKRYKPRYLNDGIMKMYATSQQAIDDVANDYYNNHLNQVYDSHQKKQEKKIKEVMNANKNPYAAVSMAQHKNDPMEVIDNTMNDVDMDALREMVAPLAGRAGFDTDEYINAFIKPTLKDMMIKKHVDKNKPKNSLEYILRSAAANSLFGKGVNLAVGNKSGLQLERESLAAYDASHLENLAAGVGGLVLDIPVFKGFGMVSNAVVGNVTSSFTKRLATRIQGYHSTEGMSLGYATRIAERIIRENLPTRIIQSATTTGLTLGSYDFANSVAEDVIYNESVDVERARGAFTKSFLTGSVLGTMGHVFQRKIAGLTGGRKVAASVGVLSTESAVFTASTEIDKALHGVDIAPIDIVNDYVESATTLGVMKLVHTKPKRIEYKFDRKGQLKEKFQLSKSEQEELRELDMNPEEFMEMVETSLKFPSEGIGSTYYDVVEKYLTIMQSKDVSATTKSKLMYLIENKITSTPPLPFDYSVEIGKSGDWILTTYDFEGNKIERHTFEHSGNAKNYLLAHKGDFRKNKIAAYERELLQVFDSQNFLRQAGLYVKETGVGVEEVSEALYKRARNMEMTPRESSIVRDIMERTTYNETGMTQFLADMRREIEKKYMLREGSMLDNIDLPFYSCTKAENAALDEYADLVRNEATLLKHGADPDRATELKELGDNSAFKGMSNDEVKHQEVLDFKTNHSENRNPNAVKLEEKLINIEGKKDADCAWSIAGVENTPEDLQSYKNSADAIAKKLNVDIEYVWDERDIPRPVNGDKYDITNYNNMIRSKGWAEKGNKVVINLPNIESIEDLEKTVVHEAVVHIGLPRLFGNHFQTLLEELYRRATPGVRSGIHDMKYTYKVANNYTLIEEYLASLVEKNASRILDSTIYDNMRSFVKNSLVKMKIYTGRNRRVTNEELVDLLRQHVKYMKNRTEPSKYRRWVFGLYDAAKLPAETYTDKEAYGDYVKGRISEGKFLKNTPRYLYDQKAFENYEYMPEEQQAIFRKRWNATDEEIRRVKSGDSFRLTYDEPAYGKSGVDHTGMADVNSRLERKYNEAMRIVKALEKARNLVPDFDKEGATDRAFATDYQFSPDEFKRRFPTYDEFLIHKFKGGYGAPSATPLELEHVGRTPIRQFGDLKRYLTGPLDIIYDMLQQEKSGRYDGER